MSRRLLDMGADTSTAAGRLVVAVLAAVAEWERGVMLERTRAGMAAARRAGRRLYRCHQVDHPALFRALSGVRGQVLATYPDEEAVRLLASEHGFRVGTLEICDSHRRQRVELLLRRGTPGRAVR